MSEEAYDYKCPECDFVTYDPLHGGDDLPATYVCRRCNKETNRSRWAKNFEFPMKQSTPTTLSRRDQLAGMAMQGQISNHTLRGPTSECAYNAVQYADALIRELDQ